MNPGNTWGNLGNGEITGIFTVIVPMLASAIVLYQLMFIDSMNAPVAYNSSGPNGSTNQLEIDIHTVPVAHVWSAVSPSGGNQVIECEDYRTQ